MTSSCVISPTESGRRSALEQLPNELGVIILKQLPTFMQLNFGRVSRACANFQLLTTTLQKTLFICLTCNGEEEFYDSVLIPDSPFPTKKARLLSVTDGSSGTQRPLDGLNYKTLMYNSGIIINVDRLKDHNLDNTIDGLGIKFPNLSEIIFLSYRITSLELGFINRALTQWSAGLQVLKFHLRMGDVKPKAETDRQWADMLGKLQTMNSLQSLTIDCTEAILEKYRKIQPQPNEPLFPMLATLRELYLYTHDSEDLAYSSFEHYARHNPHLERVGFEFLYIEQLLFSDYAKLGQQISSRVTHLNTLYSLQADQLLSTVRSFPSLTVLQLEFDQQIEYKNTMALLAPLPNLVELMFGVTPAFDILSRQAEQETAVTPVTSVKALRVTTDWPKHGILKKLYILDMFPNVQHLELSNLSSFCVSMHCETLKEDFAKDEHAFSHCLTFYLDSLKTLIKRLDNKHFKCTYFDKNEWVKRYIGDYLKLIKNESTI